ncbi:MAG: SpoIIE family protein phosphatase [Flavobacteriales bacterium]
MSFGTSQGLYRLKNAEFVPTCRYGQIFCDSSRQVFRFATGSKGELWINDVIGGRIKNLIPKRNGYRIDSTVFRALNLGSIRSFLPERSRTWLGGDQGLACYFPKVKIDPDRKWACRLKKVWGSGDSLLFGGTYFEKGGGEPLTVGSTTLDRVPVKEQPDQMIPELPYSKNRMEFSFAAPFPTQQEAVVYSYKLSGFDTAWSKWTKEVEKEYTNLPEGVYNFKVKARNIYLKESTTAEYRFTILPPWYRTYTAYGLYTFGGIAFIWMIVRLNARRLLAQKQRLEHVVEERTKEIREQKELVEEQKKEVEEQQRETEKQKEKVEEQREIAEERREKIEEAHREITDSIDYAQKIQYALLQSEEQIAPHLPGYFILFKPQSQVSGDFYWSKEHKGHFYIAAVDCTGHGVPGAFMSMLGISQLNEIMNTDELLTPAYILTELRDRVVRELSGSDPESAAKDGMDAALVRIPLRKEGEGKSEKGEERDGEDHLQGEGFNPHREEGDNNSYSKGEGFNPRSHEGNEDESTVDVEFAGAQNPLYVIRKGIAEEPPSVSMEQQGEDRVGSDPDTNPIKPFKKSSDGIEIKGDPMAVGYDEYGKESFTNVDIQLQKGDTLYIFSDGYADQFGGPKGKKFRYGPFKQLLTNIHEKPLDAQKRELDKTFEDWKEESQQEQIDDVVVVGMSL